MPNTSTVVIGNLTADPELKFINSGVPVSNFTVAVNDAKDQPPSFIDVVAWRDLGEHVVNSLTKGTRVLVVGRLQQRTWQDKEGNKRSRIEVVAESIGPDLRWANCTVVKAEQLPLDSELPSKQQRDAAIGQIRQQLGGREEPF
jgi:single-strand DNA-binding protein